jgi:hypothetical protein
MNTPMADGEWELRDVWIIGPSRSRRIPATDPPPTTGPTDDRSWDGMTDAEAAADEATWG